MTTQLLALVPLFMLRTCMRHVLPPTKKKASFQGDDRTSASHVRIINSTLFHFLVPPLKVHLPSSCHQSLQ